MEDVSDALRDFLKRAQNITTPEAREKGINFEPRPDDVVLVTPPKSGTSWIQQICHGLRTNGSMDFDNLVLVCPVLEMAHDYGYTDLQKDQVAEPRLFTTHYWYPQCPKGAGKYIYLVRDPKDAAVSGYHFFNGWVFEKDSISLEEFILKVFIRKGAIGPMHAATNWHNIASWYPHRNDDNVLWLHFEDLKEDLAACVKIIAEFLDIGANDEELQALATKQATLEFMKEHHEKFDVGILNKARGEALGIAPDAGTEEGSRKIRKGQTGEAKKVLSQEILNKLDAVWKEELEPVSGYVSYAEMRSGINKELGRRFASAA